VGSLELDGLGDFDRALSIKEHALHRAIDAAMGRIVNTAHATMAEHLRTYSHPFGTPTPSPPGHPPALVTGHLVRGIKDAGPHWESQYVVTGSVGPTAVYARIQEKGGITGRGYATHLPPRPYVGPTTRIMKPRAYSMLVRATAEAMGA